MIKVQRPLCPDITFRLIHDISPDTLGDITDDENLSKKDLRITDFLSETYSNWFRSSDYKDKNAKNKEYIKSSNKTSDSNKKEIVCETDDALRFLEHALKEKSPYKSSCVNIVDKIPSKKDFICAKNEWNEKQLDNRHSPEEISFKENKPHRRPRKLPEIPKKHPGLPAANNKSLAEELGEVLVAKLEEDSDDVFDDNSEDAFLRRHAGHLFDKALRSSSSSPKNNRSSRSCSNSTDSDYCAEEPDILSRQSVVSSNSGRDRKGSDGFKRQSTSSSYICLEQHELEVTHRGMHRFITRHEDEMMIEIGDPIHVTKEGDDLWCKGINLRTGQKGLFPAMYATDLHFLEDEEESEDEGEFRKYNLQFLGSVEVTCHKGDEVLCQAVNKVALTRRSNLTTSPPPVCSLEISQYGIRMIDKSKEGHESDHFSHFFALKNISFCGTHPRNDRYFAFITKHPSDQRFACHVFLGEKSTHKVTDALGFAFKRFYQEYMAFTHPTEDIYID
ncbi:hypothetical protein SNE40_019026 [Patella caerulea]|uniref:JNK-interacting protein 1 n=1 Tax=Patella caerulea TaxID=87958 RepID=A0AAN8J9S7_PATCE